MKVSKNWLNRGVQILWGAAILTLPFQKFILLLQVGDSGRFNPYASVTLQMSEGLILMAFLLWALGHRQEFKKNRQRFGVAVGTTLLIMLPVLWANNFDAAGGAIFHWMAAIATIALIRQQVLPHKTVVLLFLSTMSLQTILGIVQVGLGHSVGLATLGESIVAAQNAGSAKMIIAEKTFLRAYGTFPHPNVLAGYLVVALTFLVTLSKKWEKGEIALAIILGIGLLLTGSKAAIIAILITLLIRNKIANQKKVLIAGTGAFIVLLTFPFWKNAEFITERWELLKISLTMLMQQPWGVGPHHFTLAMQDFTALKLQPWQFQPVHNVYLLIANEWGVWMGILFALGGLHLLRNHLKKPTLLLVLPLLLIGLADHYLVSLPQGILLTGFIVGWLTGPANGGALKKVLISSKHLIP